MSFRMMGQKELTLTSPILIHVMTQRWPDGVVTLGQRSEVMITDLKNVEDGLSSSPFVFAISFS